MAYNPNPPYNPSDYGTHGRIDYDRMEKSLQDTRDQIASFNTSDGVQSTNSDKVLSGIANKEQPVYGAGVPVYETARKDPSEYGQYTGGPPQFYLDRQADFKESQDNFEAAMAAMNTKPKEQKADKNKTKKQEKEALERLKLPSLEGEVPDLPDSFFGSKTKTTGGGLPDKQGKASFDGKKFEKYLSTDGDLKEISKLRDAGMSDSEIQEWASRSGITNVDDKSDQKTILSNWKKYQDGGYDQKTTKQDDPASVDTMYEWYLDQGGKEFDTKDGLKEAGIGNYNSNNDAQKFGSYLQDQLGQGNVSNLFGKQFGMKDYKGALDYENQDKKYIKKYLKDYAEKGGTISDKVQALFPSAFPGSSSNLSGSLGPFAETFFSPPSKKGNNKGNNIGPFAP